MRGMEMRGRGFGFEGFGLRYQTWILDFAVVLGGRKKVPDLDYWMGIHEFINE